MSQSILEQTVQIQIMSGSGGQLSNNKFFFSVKLQVIQYYNICEDYVQDINWPAPVAEQTMCQISQSDCNPGIVK